MRGMRGGFPLLITAAAILLVAGCAGSPDGDASSTASDTAAGNSASPTPDQESASPPPPSPATAAAGATGTAEPGALVGGFPADLIPVMDKTEVLVPHPEPTGVVVALPLTASTDPTAEKVLDYYDDIFTDQNFNPLEDGSVEGAASQTYARGGGTETVNISAVEDEDGTTYTIGAHVLPGTVEQKP